MAYPTDNPVAKHDILCSTSIIDIIHQKPPANNDTATTPLETIDTLTSSVVQSAIPISTLPSDIIKLSTIYTYPDAPTSPKPLSRAPRVWRLARRVLFDQSTTTNTSNKNLLQRCTIAVKLPNIIPDDIKAQKNTKTFHKFIQYLHSYQLVAVLACDSAGRICFIVPSNNSNDVSTTADGYYSAYLYYANMKEFLPWCRENYTNNASTVSTLEEPTTWTPQYTPPPDDECKPHGWDDINTTTNKNEKEDDEPSTWTPQYTPPPEEECGPRGWDGHNIQGEQKKEEEDDGTAGLFVPPGASSGNGNANDEDSAGLWGWNANNNDDTTTNNNKDDGWGGDAGSGGWDTAWNTSTTTNEEATSSTTDNTGIGGWTSVEPTKNMNEGVFHANTGAAAADAFYSGLTRTLDTRADSRLYHMRAFNGWVKATQIAELDPDTSRASSSTSNGKKRSRLSPLRVLDLACGKGGDLGKWTIHQRKIENYVGVDVARGSLVDAALRARQMNKRKGNTLRKCTFTLADLGEDVPGRKRSKKALHMQKLLTWNLQNESSDEQNYDPVFVPKEGGGIDEADKFDVVSIQFAIHYMMSTRKRARRFFHTVSSLLEVGGNLIATTIDARVVVEKLMGLGLDLHFDDIDTHAEVDKPENQEKHHNGNKSRKVKDENGATVVSVGQGVCRLKFDAETLHKVFQPSKDPEDMFGLQYTFTLVEGSDHAAGVGEAVDLPEWLTPIRALEELAEESGLKLEYATNFHKFYEERKNPRIFPQAHNALYNMKVLNRDGSISTQEWDVSRMYIALKFRKVKESTVDLKDGDIGEDEMRE